MKLSEVWNYLPKPGTSAASGTTTSSSSSTRASGSPLNESPEKAMEREFFNLKVKELENYIHKVEEIYGSVEQAPSRVIHKIIQHKEFLMEYEVKKGFELIMWFHPGRSHSV